MRAIIALLLTLAAGAAAAGAPAQTPTPASDYVVDRLDREGMERLVAGPLAQIRAGDVEAALASFEAMLGRARARHGEASVEVADLLMAFGATLYTEARSAEDEALLARAVGFVERSVPAYRAAFGAGHPEVAVALNSYADVLRNPAPENPPAAAEEALAEAYRIRLAALGPSHPETLWTILYLAQVRAVPARIASEPSLLDAVAADLERAAEWGTRGDDTAADIPLIAHARRAELFARHGRTLDARRAFAAAQAAARQGDPFDSCLALAQSVEEIREALAARGGREKAESIAGARGPRSFEDCFALTLEAPAQD